MGRTANRAASSHESIASNALVLEHSIPFSRGEFACSSSSATGYSSDSRYKTRNEKLCSLRMLIRPRADPPSMRSEHNFLFSVFYWLPLEYHIPSVPQANGHHTLPVTKMEHRIDVDSSSISGDEITSCRLRDRRDRCSFEKTFISGIQNIRDQWLRNETILFHEGKNLNLEPDRIYQL